MLTASYAINHSLGIKTYRGKVVCKDWEQVINLDRLNKADAIHDATIEIALLNSISKHPDSQF